MDIVKLVKLFHVFFLTLWLGSFVTLFPLLKAKLSGPFLRSRYLNFQLPCMILTILLGIVLLINSPEKLKMGWFHMKLTGALGLIICDLISGKMALFKARTGELKSKKRTLALQIITILFLLLTLAAIYIVKK
jgi:uncharacterized membrane protein